MDTIYIIDDKFIYRPSVHTLQLQDSREIVMLAVSSSMCLNLLLENQGKIILRDELLESVWGSRGMHVSPNTLYQNISLLRKSLIKLGVESAIIQTIPRRGFMFSGDITVDKRNDRVILDNADAPAEQAVKKNRGIVFGASVFIVMTIVACILISIKKVDSLFVGYASFIAPGNCKAYRNRDSLASDDYYADFLIKKNISCGKGKNIYLTNYYPSIRTSVIICQRPIISSREPGCVSSYYY